MGPETQLLLRNWNWYLGPVSLSVYLTGAQACDAKTESVKNWEGSAACGLFTASSLRNSGD